VIALTKRLALELGSHGINVNGICPGFIRTDMAPASVDERGFEVIAGRAMLRRIGRPEDIAAAALYLASDEAAFITAQILTPDGGRTNFLSRWWIPPSTFTTARPLAVPLRPREGPLHTSGDLRLGRRRRYVGGSRSRPARSTPSPTVQKVGTPVGSSA
jgi:NAD(P)-dependent dehydrogenase (short-subunit alcohol dehydrogenase family)